MTDTIPVFVNERRVLVPRGGTAAMAAAQADLAPPVIITDARGLPVPPDTALTTGAILRVSSGARRAGTADAER